MARIASIKEGADGIVTATTADGSLFRFHALDSAWAVQTLGLEHADDKLVPGMDIPEEALELAVQVLQAENHALNLLARAEQYSCGLHRKLTKAGWAAVAVTRCLGHLTERGLLSDERYASSWIRQRVRRHAEGPRSLESALLARGLGRDALRAALAASLEGDARAQAALAAWRLLARKKLSGRDAESAFMALGWKKADMRTAQEMDTE